MGTDNLHHRRKAKSARELRRRQAKRESYAKVLIVCEGEKTEPNYFNGLREHYGLNTANVEVTGESGSDPKSIFQFAQQRFREESDRGDPYDRVFCVFDKDTHATYQQALAAIDRANPEGVFVAVTSIPCFEYWLLLHYTYTTRPYTIQQTKSAAEQVISELKQYIPNYQKGTSNIFKQLIDSLEFAKANSARALQEAVRNGTDNPSTRIHELVSFLQTIKQA